MLLLDLQAKHAAGEHSFGVDGETGKVVDMKEHGLYESAAVKVQTLKTAIEVRSLLVSTGSVRGPGELMLGRRCLDRAQSACLLLRVDDIVSAKRPQGEGGPGVQQGEVGEEGGGA